jgi:DnaJ domain
VRSWYGWYRTTYKAQALFTLMWLLIKTCRLQYDSCYNIRHLDGLGSSEAPSAQLYTARACRLLEVDTTAAPADIKAAFRKKALALHPDVNSAPDATERFTEVSQAYGVSIAPLVPLSP